MKSILPQSLFFLLLCITVQSARANDQEREVLSRLLHELNYLDNVIIVAKQSASDNSFSTFDYDALEHDLTQVKTGITDYLNQERREPRVIEAITGDYTDSEGLRRGD